MSIMAYLNLAAAKGPEDFFARAAAAGADAVLLPDVRSFNPHKPPTICMRRPSLGLKGIFSRSRRFSGESLAPHGFEFSGALWDRHLAALGEDRSASFGS